MIALCHESSFRLSWARSSSVQASTEGFNLESLAFLIPSTSKGGTTVEQLCHKEFAKSLILPYYYFWRCIVEGWVHLFCKQTRGSSKKIRTDLGHKIIVQRQNNRNYKDELKISIFFASGSYIQAALFKGLPSVMEQLPKNSLLLAVKVLVSNDSGGPKS